MNATMHEKINAVSKDIEEQLDTIRAIKGDRYANALDFAIKAMTMNSGAVNLCPKPSSAEDALKTLLLVRVVVDGTLALVDMHFKTLGFESDEAGKKETKEILTEADRILNATCGRLSTMLSAA